MILMTSNLGLIKKRKQGNKKLTEFIIFNYFSINFKNIFIQK